MHSEMRFGDCIVMVGSEWSPLHKSPKSIDGFNTNGPRTAGRRRRRALRTGAKGGCRDSDGPTTLFYGDRTYRVVDPEGHIWSFGQTVKRMTSDEWDKAMGVKTKTRL
jgi:uncharacterized glyoxalase superfamily protein PhnB